MVSRILLLPPEEPVLALLQRIRHLAESRSVMVVAARRPMRLLKPAFAASGADLGRIFILDVVTDYLAAQVSDPEHEAFVNNPTLLELIAKRTNLIVRKKAERPATTVVDDMASFLQYATVDSLVEVIQNALAMSVPGNDHEYVIMPGSVPQGLLDRLGEIVDERCRVALDGTVLPA